MAANKFYNKQILNRTQRNKEADNKCSREHEEEKRTREIGIGIGIATSPRNRTSKSDQNRTSESQSQFNFETLIPLSCNFTFILLFSF
jgi:hypothetical protein